jgi:hypothetical protein
MSRIEIILSEPSQTAAYKASLCKNNELLRSEFRGPVFTDAKYKFNSVGIEVHVAKDEVYFYPAHSIGRVKISPSEVPE